MPYNVVFGPDICGPSTKDDTGNDMYEDKLCAMLMCPVTDLNMNGKFHFSFVPDEATYNPKICNLQPQPAIATATATCNDNLLSVYKILNLLSVYKTHNYTRNDECARNDKRARYAIIIKTWGDPGGEASEAM